MSKWIVILKNNSGSAVEVSDLGFTIANGAQRTISNTFKFDEISTSADLKTLIGNGTFVVNNGVDDLDATNGVEYVFLENKWHVEEDYVKKGEFNHEELNNRTIPDQHNIGSITNLTEELSAKASVVYVQTVLQTHVDDYHALSAIHTADVIALSGYIDATSAALSAHMTDVSNPHEVVASQVASDGPSDVQSDIDWLEANKMDNLSYWTENGDASTWSAWVPVGGVDVTAMVLPKGTGAFQLSSTGNARGQYAVDLQRSRASVAQVASGDYSTIAGGRSNTNSSSGSFIGGGQYNIVDTSSRSSIVGGEYNQIIGTIGGGSTCSIVGGGNNEIRGTSFSAFIGGGGANIMESSDWGTILGGSGNELSGGNYSIILGGDSNYIKGASAEYCIIGGGRTNIMDGQGNEMVGQSILGGENNKLLGYMWYSTIVGGEGNYINAGSLGDYSFIGGGSGNKIDEGTSSTIAGGYTNIISGGNYTVIAGGRNNTAERDYAFVGGGNNNDNTGIYAVIAGGGDNDTSGYYSFMGGGSLNDIVGQHYSTIVSGYDSMISGAAVDSYNFVGSGRLHNILSCTHSFIGGGDGNTITDTTHSFIGGGGTNAINQGTYDVIAGGGENTLSTITGDISYCAIGGGQLNNINGFTYWATICGGEANKMYVHGGSTYVDWSTICGGTTNTISGGTYSFIGGGDTNSITLGQHSFIGGGLGNKVTAQQATIGGGNNNIVSGLRAAIAGGYYNTASAQSSTVGGGDNNIAGGTNATVAGGYYNITSSTNTTIGGGYQNSVASSDGTIGGGRWNKILAGGGYNVIAGGGGANDGDGNEISNSSYCTIAGGYNNTLSASDYSFMGGGQSNSIVYDASRSVICGGEGNTITIDSGYNIIVGGYFNTVTNGGSSFIGCGEYNEANQQYSGIIAGKYAKTRTFSQVAHAGGRFSVTGDAQRSQYVCGNTITSATKTWLLADLGSGGIYIEDGQTMTVLGTVTAKTSDAGTNEIASWKVEGVVSRAGSTITVHDYTITTIYNPTSWTIDISEVSSNHWGIGFTATGWTANIRAVAQLDTSEVIFA